MEMSQYRMVQKSNLTEKLHFATCGHGTHIGMSAWTCETNCSKKQL